MFDIVMLEPPVNTCPGVPWAGRGSVREHICLDAILRSFHELGRCVRSATNFMEGTWLEGHEKAEPQALQHYKLAGAEEVAEVDDKLSLKAEVSEEDVLMHVQEGLMMALTQDGKKPTDVLEELTKSVSLAIYVGFRELLATHFFFFFQ